MGEEVIDRLVDAIEQSYTDGNSFTTEQREAVVYALDYLTEWPVAERMEAMGMEPCDPDSWCGEHFDGKHYVEAE